MTSPLSLTVPCASGDRLQLEFIFREGRYRQTISLTDPSGVLLDQWEETSDSADEDWPASPPIQQLSLESIQDRPTLLGVGQAGKSHWSISVETIEGDTGETLRFDVACRVRALPNWLGSTYRRTDAVASQTARLGLTNESTEVKPAQDLLTCVCTIKPESVTKYPATLRWSYRITHPSPLL